MEFTILYWHWLIFGMVLLIAELFLGSLTIFWFGLGALVIAAILFLVPGMGLSRQLFIWAVLSGCVTLLWFRYIKPLMGDRTKAGISREAVLGEAGHVIKVPGEGSRGIVRFATPLLGSDEWPFICEQEVSMGDRVFIKDISGNTLIVEKRQ
jgi:membrane protein implicated in regulation of membrane protease activity